MRILSDWLSVWVVPMVVADLFKEGVNSGDYIVKVLELYVAMLNTLRLAFAEHPGPGTPTHSVSPET